MVRTVDETAVTSAAGAGSAPLVLGRYRLLRRLGAGAFGVVHLARDETLGRLVAIKRIELHDERVAARAAREAQAAARLSHPGIVALFEAARDDHAVHLVSEAVRGRTLAELLAAGGLSDHDALRIGAALCDALEHAHLRGVVHRDVKPANVIVPDEPGGEAEIAKLTDFGVAWIADDDALTRTGDVVGTLAYMAPEQAEGRPAGPPADLYSLALVLFEALSGVNPVRAPGAAATVRRVGSRLPPLGRLRRDLPRGLCAAIDRALLARPDQRGSLTELRDALDGALEEAAVEHGPVGPSAFETTHASLHRTLAHDAHAPHPAWTVGAGTSRPRRTAALGADARAPMCGRARRGRALARRCLAGAGAGALVGAVLTMLPDGAPAGAPVVAAAAAVATGALPRVGWLLSVLAAVVSLAIAGSPGSALLVSAAALPCVLLMRSPALWSAPLLAVLLGLGGLALAWVALAGQAGGWLRRASLGALGLWWLALTELLTGRALLFTAPPAGAPPAGWERSLAAAGADVLTPLVSGPTLAACALWALAAAVLPWLVRGSRLAFDLVAAAAWTAAVAAGTAAIAAVELRGALAGAVLAAALALAGATARAARAPSSDVWADTAGEWADTI